MLDVKFMSNKISLNNQDFSTFVEKTLNKNASNETVVKTAEDDEAETSGQPQAEAKLVNEPEKEEPSVKGAGDDCEAETSGQPQAEAKLVNHPKVEADATEEVKKAETTEDAEEEVEEEKEEDEVKEAAGVDNFGDKKAEPFGSKKEDKDDKDDKDDDKDDKDDEDEKEEKEAKNVIKFVKVAKLNAKTKAMLRTYWGQLFSAEYADAMVTDE